MREVNGIDQDSLAKVWYNAALSLCWDVLLKNMHRGLTVDYNIEQYSQ